MSRQIKRYYHFLIDEKKEKMAPVAKIYLSVFGLPALGKFFRLKILDRRVKAMEVNNAVDLGCGYGELSLMLSQKGAKVKAYDLAKEPVSRLNKFAKENKLTIEAKAIDLEKLDIGEEYDFIACIAVIDYLDDPDVFIKRISKKVVKSGHLCVGFPLEKRLVSKQYEKLAHAITKRNGFKEDQIVRSIRSLGYILESKDYYLPFNLFYYMSWAVSLLNKMGMNYDLALSSLYPGFLLLSKIAQKFFANQGTEVILIFRKI